MTPSPGASSLPPTQILSGMKTRVPQKCARTRAPRPRLARPPLPKKQRTRRKRSQQRRRRKRRKRKKQRKHRDRARRRSAPEKRPLAKNGERLQNPSLKPKPRARRARRVKL